MKPFAPLIRYRCTNPEHQRTTKTLSDTMTIHERSWAYCPYDVRVTDHDGRWRTPRRARAMQLRALADLPARG